MAEEQKYINVSSRRFAYVLPTPTTRHLHKVGLYAPSEVFVNYYKTFSSHLDYTVLRDYKEGIINKDVVSMMIYMSLNRDSNFSKRNIEHNLKEHKKLFYDCKIYTSPVSIPKLIIDPLKNRGYRYVAKKFSLKKYDFMAWIDAWVKKQDLGSEVYIFENAYSPKVKGYLIGEGYDEMSENHYRKVRNPLRAKYVYL